MADNSIAELQSQIDTITAEKDAMTSKLEALYYIEAMDETMYVISEANIYDDLYDGLLENEAAGALLAEQEIKVTGKSNIIDWYEIDAEGTKKYISAGLISEAKPSQQSSGGNKGSQSSGESQTTQQQSPATDNNEAFNVPGTISFGGVPVTPDNDGSGAGGTDINWQ